MINRWTTLDLDHWAVSNIDNFQGLGSAQLGRGKLSLVIAQ